MTGVNEMMLEAAIGLATFSTTRVKAADNNPRGKECWGNLVPIRAVSTMAMIALTPCRRQQESPCHSNDPFFVFVLVVVFVVVVVVVSHKFPADYEMHSQMP